MLIYAYADILGYRELLKNRKATEVYSLLNEAVTEVHRMLNQYMKSELVLKQYKNSLYGESNYWELFFNGNIEKIMGLKEEINAKTFYLKTYIAFDTIIVYWDDFSISETNVMLFLLAIDLLYLILYDRNILIRGAIGTTNDYYIDEVGNERFFIIDNISKAAEIEKNQDCANLIVFGQDLSRCFYSISNQGLTDDYYSRLDYYYNDAKRDFLREYPDTPRVDFKDGFVGRVVAGNSDVSAIELFGEIKTKLSPRSSCITICPINNLTFSYLGLDFFEKLYRKVDEIYSDGPGTTHADLLQFNTACFLFARLTSDIYNATTIMPLWGDCYQSELPVDKRSVNDMWMELKERVGYGK